MLEIAEELELPASLRDEFFNRGYYGTVNHNAKAVYQRYLGWFDGNPAHLHPLPPTEAGRRYVELLGGTDEVVRLGRAAFAAGDYRWVAELVNHAVFGDPQHAGARALQADALEQLGYQAESAPWRDFYLTGAQELRAGGPPFRGLSIPAIDAGTASAMSAGMLLDYLAVRLHGPSADGWSARFGVVVADRGEEYVLALEHATLRHWRREVRGALDRPDVPGAPGSPHEPWSADVDAVLTLSHADLADLALGTADVGALEAAGRLRLEGDGPAVTRLLGLFETFDTFFDIVLP
jgi:alkyl sulfatase BDS1-like metallo-beta-lactamase superfamily hydrolase